MFKSIPVEDAVGMVLGHDVTRIVPGEFKGPAFKKGHVIKPEDIPMLLDMGKDNIYVLDLKDDLIHENDAAERIAKGAAGKGIDLTEPSEGRVNLLASNTGLLSIKVEALRQINMVEDIVLATLHGNQQIVSGTALAGTRIIPLAIHENIIRQVEEICSNYFPVIDVKPFRALNIGLITTGSEVYSGRIEDKFGPVVKDKFAELGCRVTKQVLVSDDIDLTVKAIHDLIGEGADLIALTGGMSVDPDDQTPASIRAAGGKVVTYGAPVFPGAMFMLAHIGDIP
ncbi:molybdopterin-binding protein, partial [Deltaproteobacteria bacterium]|nr:molybdopterin-binding protein [Deltaproteobacteria bacterium]